LRIALMLALPLALSYFLWGPNLEADWGPIDDHVLFQLMGPDHSMRFAEIPASAANGETLNPGKSLRYRMLLIPMLSLQTALFGDDVALWYAARILVFGLMLSAAWYLLDRVVGFWLAGAFTLLLSSHGYWGRIWACLGPSETFMAPACVMLVFGCWLVWREQEALAGSRVSRGLGWSLILIGGLICINVKENMPFMAAPALWLAWRDWRRRRLNWLPITVSVLLLGTAAFTTGAIAIAAARSGADFYARPVAAGGRGRAALMALVRAPLPLAIFVLSAAFFAVARGKWRSFARVLFLWEAILFASYFSQLVFYNGAWEPTSRYGFPGDTIVSFMWFLPVLVAWPGRQALPGWSAARERTVAIALCCAMLAVVGIRGYQVSREVSRMNVSVTRTFSGAIRTLAERTRGTPDVPIVIYSRSMNDIESIGAAKDYLRYLGVRNPIILRIDPREFKSTGWDPALATALTPILELWRSGNEGFTSDSRLNGLTECYELTFTGAPYPGSPCRFAGRLSP
jgi:hypothetical protein